MSAAAVLAVAVAATGWTASRRVSLVDEARILPSEHPAIDYWSAKPADAVADLQARIDSGEVTLDHDRRFGYLPAVLEALDVPASSQVLVFSKTSFQAVRIVPRVPRSIYHNPEVAVGWVRGGDVVELASLDPKLGVVFYTLHQAESSRPWFQAHTTQCIGCHLGPATLGVPGLLVRSVHTDRSGTVHRARAFITDHRSPLEERWGGWYVSGEHGKQTHMGNVTYERDLWPTSLLGTESDNAESLYPYINPYNYLSPGSDIVSLMVLEHQTRMTNLIVRLGYETRIALAASPAAEDLSELPKDARPAIEAAAEELLRYMLFTDEALLDEPVRGSDDFKTDFESAGPQDKKGRSLHALDLDRRLLRYPCSYLIYSKAFGALPSPAKDFLLRRLWQVLTGQDESDEFSRLTTQDKRAILEILLDTIPELPAYWRG